MQSAWALCDAQLRLFRGTRFESSCYQNSLELARVRSEPPKFVKSLQNYSEMSAPSQYWLILAAGTLGVCCLCWKTSITLTSPSVLAKASIQVDLSLPSPSIITQSLLNTSTKRQTNHSGHHLKKRHEGPVSRFMIQLYNRRPNADIVRALKPRRITVPSIKSQNMDAGRILEFEIPSMTSNEELMSVELLGIVGTILRVRSLDQPVSTDIRISRRDDIWRAFDVTPIVNDRKGNILRLLVKGRWEKIGGLKNLEPILVLSYAKPTVRRSRAVHDEDRQDQDLTPWIEEGGRRLRRRNLCRRRPLYVDFSLIAYDEWVVAPPGYEAYQCVGKCFYPFADHLSPTKHAIIQTLVHGALQGADGVNNKPVGRACCVPTRLAPTSLLYIDASGTLTYQYGYEDMVVAECGCR